MATRTQTVLKRVDLETYVKRNFLDKSFNRSGLCAYCSRRITCVLSSDYGLVYDCDDYDPGEESTSAMIFSTLDMSTEEQEPDYGLCSQCQNRDICQLKMLSGGIWHCDEYQ